MNLNVMDNIVLTPAERALLVEQAETARVALEEFIQQCKGGTSGQVVRSYVPVAQAIDYASGVLTKKISTAVREGMDQ